VQVLLFNFFYYNRMPLIFGSAFFKQEILAINWQYTKLDLVTWKKTFPFFIFKTTVFSKSVDAFYSGLKKIGFRLFLIADCEQHRKLLYYLNKSKAFSIGLVTGNLDPWLVSFALPILSTNLLVQGFFLRFIVLTQKQAAHKHFEIKKTTWVDIQHKSFLIPTVS
jgi:hypothetical protein